MNDMSQHELSLQACHLYIVNMNDMMHKVWSRCGHFINMLYTRMWMHDEHVLMNENDNVMT